MSRITEEEYAGKYVQKKEQERALEVLREELENGGDAKKITGIRDDYYREKVISGLCPMSALIYYRISLKRELPDPEIEKVKCLRCGAEIGENGLYCNNCRDVIREERRSLLNQVYGGARFGFSVNKKPKRFSSYE